MDRPAPVAGAPRGSIRMIRYSLRCAQDHRFESWFQSADAFDKLAAAGMLTCAVCGSGKVDKALMAPSVKAAPGPEAGAEARPLATPTTELERKIAELKRLVEQNSDYVGRDFARLAREMHEGTAEHRAIWGEAKPEEAKRLIEDGVPVAPLPFRPTGKSN